MSYTTMRHPASGAALDQVVRDSDGAVIPLGVDTPESLAYAAWLAEGNRPAAAAEPVAVATFTGNQWALAIGDLGLAATFLAALSASKAGDRHRYGFVARDTVLDPDDPLLARICARGGAALDLAALAAHARTMPR